MSVDTSSASSTEGGKQGKREAIASKKTVRMHNYVQHQLDEQCCSGVGQRGEFSRLTDLSGAGLKHMRDVQGSRTWP